MPVPSGVSILVPARLHRKIQSVCAMVSKQNPVDRVMDVGGHTGGIQETGLQIDAFRQVEFLGCLGSSQEQLARELTHLFLGPPGALSLASPFPLNAHAVYSADAPVQLEQ